MQETWVWPLSFPWRRERLTHSSILAWRIPWTVQSMASQRIRHDWATFTHSSPTRYKTKQKNFCFWRVGSKSRVLCMPPAHKHQEKDGQTTEATLPAWPLDTPLLSTHIRIQLTPSQRGIKQRNLLLVVASSHYNKGPNKALSEFLVASDQFLFIQEAKSPGH